MERRDSMTSSKILIRGVNWIGDAVMTTPAITAIRKMHPESEISLLIKPFVSPIFEKDPSIDEIILYEDRYRGILGRLMLVARLKEKKFSRAILFQNAFNAALIPFLAGIPERTGYNRYKRGLLLTKPVQFSSDDRRSHHINYYLNLLGISLEAGLAQPWIYLSVEERVSARSMLSKLKRPILGINHGATYGSAKRWFPGRFAAVADRFMADTQGSVVIFGSKNETDMAEEIEKAIKRDRTSHLLNLAGKTSLRGLSSLISECDLFVTNDSGPMHIAYAVGTPTVAIFGSTDPEQTGPVGIRNKVLRADIACSPCFSRTCKDNNMKCMHAITSADVYSEISDIIPSKKAVFFDRDGTLCRDVGYLNDWRDFKVFQTIDGLKVLKSKGFSLIGVSNQSGIRRGIVGESFAKEVNRFFVDRHGFDDFYCCPHLPGDHCPCRKPEPWMLMMARAEHGIDLKRSYVVGDKESDMLLAKAVGAKGILVKTGKQQQSHHADFTAKDLKEAIDFIMLHE
ncbi:lipopolysaccharide heptosyltransferase II [Thermodesulfovibrionales bacterium]|nr:lipopolysaccharide heptosyltransferase II [Thermodesulfovibrionales bacterium]MCL0083567.1 lipopolysaccharide heptosyltransferase II [Thermodesulfovibrionales bacterium]MCL0085760.1 lipopolysaccharide heptosyltransferase II [Thermodesulfovibrionales bacterium]MCL0086704.1 lipopolysaccharide heptosyltransferase II [Thermodesulfovibrionales bacterium]